MPKHGLKKEELIIAAEALMSSGQKLTVSNVRRQLGNRGSNTTISRLLNEWRLEALSGDNRTDDILDFDESLEKLTIDNEQLNFESQELLEENSNLKSDLKAQKSQNHILVEQNTALKSELDKGFEAQLVVNVLLTEKNYKLCIRRE